MDVAAAGTNPFASLGLTREKESASTRELGQEDFLRLMLAQLQNQNPLEPQANGEFLGQLAQFGIVDGVQQLNGGFTDLSDRLAGEQTLAAASLLGREVLVEADGRVSGNGLSGVVQVDQPTAEVNVEILDARGETVRRMTLDGAAGGDVGFAWDGRNDAGELLPAGAYSVAASTKGTDGSIQHSTLIAGPVTAVVRDGATVQVELNGLPPANLSDIRRIA